MQKLIIALLILCTLGTATAAQQSTADGTPQHAISIIPGQPWIMKVVLKQADRASAVDTFGKQFLATVNAAPPLQDQLYASMRVEVSMIEPGSVLLTLTPAQTESLRNKTAIWTLLYLPDVGGAQALGSGRVKVNKVKTP